MPNFKTGQLVAVRINSDNPWEVAKFISMFHGLYEVWTLNRELQGWSKTYYKHCQPLEDVWDGVFLEREMEMVDRACESMSFMTRRVDWLCRQLEKRARDDEGKGLCPRGATCDGKGSCSSCWRRASRIAVKEAPCQQ